MTPRQEGVFAGFDLDSIDSINLLKLTIQMCKGTEQGGNFDDQNPLLVNSLGDATQVRTVINILESMKKNTFLRQLVEDFGRIGRYEMVAAAQRMEPLFEIAAGGPKAPGYHQAMKDYKKGSSSIVNSEMQEAAETLVQMAGGSMEQRHRRSERLAGSDRSSKGEKEIEKENAVSFTLFAPIMARSHMLTFIFFYRDWIPQRTKTTCRARSTATREIPFLPQAKSLLNNNHNPITRRLPSILPILLLRLVAQWRR